MSEEGCPVCGSEQMCECKKKELVMQSSQTGRYIWRNNVDNTYEISEREDSEPIVDGIYVADIIDLHATLEKLGFLE